MEDEGQRSPSQPPGGDLFRLLVDRVQDYAIFGLDPSGTVISWNAGAERIKGYRAHEIIGHHFSRFYPEEAIRSGWPRTELDRASEDGRFEDEGWRIRKDGTRFWANVVITALYDDEGKLRGFAKVTRDLTDRRRVEQLEADVRQVSAFVAMLAHELRNPLAPIRNAVEVAKHLDNPDRTQWALQVVERQTFHLTRMVEDLLDVSRITQGRIRLERKRIRLREVVDRAVEATASECQKRGHRFSVDERAAVLVRGDGVRLTQVLTNLFSNACKYTPDGGRIDVVVNARDSTAVVSVRDTGVGISPDLLPRLFDTFTQEARSLARSAGGLGLGLTIAQKLVEMHGGTLRAESAGPGCGSVFTIELPLLASGADEDALTAATALRVLVVDDNRDAAETLAMLLEAQGHRALVAFDGKDGVRVAREELPDLVLLDIGLPGADGYEVARTLRGEPALQGVFLVAVTGYGSEEDRKRALEAGFDLHVTKPLDYSILKRMVPLLSSS